MIPGLPAYILFMCIRHADYLNDGAKLKSLMDAVIAAVKKVISVRLNLRPLGRSGVDGGGIKTGLLVSELPERGRAAVVLAVKHASAAQLSEAVQRGGGASAPFVLVVPHLPPHPDVSLSSSKEFMKQSSPRQKKNCLQNFDLSEHRQILSDLAIHIYHQFITVMEKNLTPAVGTAQTLACH